MISLNDEVSHLKKVPIFASIDPGKLKLLAYASQRIGFEDGEIICRQGAQDGDAFFILEGAADIVNESGATSVVVARLTQYALFGEISAFCDIPRTATVKASGHVLALRIPKDYFLDLIEKSPAVALQIIRVLAQRVADTTANLASALSAKGRSNEPARS